MGVEWRRVMALAAWVTVVLPLRAEVPTDRPVYFVRDIAPIFDQFGCSGGGCHGKFGGQGGLQLSLMTLSPLVDHAPLEPFVDLANPANSPLVRKPAGQMPHGGGQRFTVDSEAYATLVEWIRQGCLNPAQERTDGLPVEPLPVSLEVSPPSFFVKLDEPRNARRRIRVTATFADGSTEDVTDRTVFEAKDDSIAEVTPKGYVQPKRWGKTVIICRYVGLVQPVFFTMPREPGPDDGPTPQRSAAGSHVDTYVLPNWAQLNLHPSPTCDDHTFLRRAHLDLVGALPTPDEIRAFVADPDPRKRERLVDRLLADERFVAMSALRFGDMLRINPDKLANGPLQQRAAMVFDTWLRDTLRANVPYDQVVRQLILAEGSTLQEGPANFYRVERTPQDRAETLGQAFLGVRLSCARCHNHPFDRWTTDDYWQFAAFGAKVQERPGELYNEGVIVRNNRAELRNDSVVSVRKGQIAVPTLLGGESLGTDYPGDYIEALAAWMTDPSNDRVSQAIVNRVWAQLMGAGIVDPVDDVRSTSVRNVSVLLPMLAEAFVEHGYDLRWLYREIATSQAYGLSAVPNATNALDDRFFSRYLPKQMPAQVMLDAINQACGTTDTFGTFPPGTTAVGLPLMMPHGFLDRFGRSGRQFLADTDPHVEPTLPQTLHLINSGYLNGKVNAEGGTVARLVETLDDEPLIEELYLRTVCRPPTDAERSRVLQYIRSWANRREAFEDLLWALITSREFVFIS